MKIAGLIKTSTIDYPGLLAAVVFTPGCNFDCFYCHNRPLLEADSSYGLDDLLEFLQKRRGLLEGVVISGGEPLLQAGLPDFLSRIRQLGYQIKLDTNGSRPGKMAELIRAGLIDYLAIDYKAPWLKYDKMSRCRAADRHKVQESFALLQESAVNWEARTTIAPLLTAADLAVMARETASLPAWYWQRYNVPLVFQEEDKDLVQAAPIEHKCLQELATRLAIWQPAISLRF